VRAAGAGRRWAGGLGLSLLVLLLVGWGLGAFSNSVVQAADVDAVRDIGTQRSATLISVAHLFSLAGSGLVIVPLGLVASAVLYRRGRRANAYALVLSTVGAVVISTVDKLIVGRARPPIHHLETVTSSSFPSGHATQTSAICLTALLILLAGRPPRRLAAAAIAATVILVSGVALSRVYLGVHYPSDVAAGVLLGGAWALLVWRVTAAGHASRCNEPDTPRPSPARPRRGDIGSTPRQPQEDRMSTYRRNGHRFPRPSRSLCVVLCVAATVMSVSAMEGVASAASLQIGKKNKSKAQTTLSSSAKKKATLALSNTGGAAAASFTTKKGKAPFNVSSTTKVKSLNADLLDGLDSSQLQLRIAASCAAGSAIRVVNSDGSVTCQPLLVSVPAAWNLRGNTGTDPTADFLGTTDGQPLLIKTNNNEVVRVTAGGAVGVGTATPGAKLEASTLGSSGPALLGTSATGGVIGRLGNFPCAGGAAVQGCGGPAGGGVSGSSDTGIGAFGNSNARGVVGTLGVVSCPGTYGVGGCADANIGVFAQSNTGIGVLGNGNARGIVGTLGGTSCAGTYGVGGCGANIGDGVLGDSAVGNGVRGTGATNGVLGTGANNGVFGTSSTGIGVRGDSTSRGVVGTLGGTSCAGTYAVGGCGADIGSGVLGDSTNDGVLGTSSHAAGGNTAAAVRAINTSGGDIFLGQAGSTHVARIDSTGKGFFDGGTQTGGADYAEAIRAVDGSQLHPGDVLAIDPGHGYAVARSGRPYSRLVVGVYSTKPAVLAVGSHKLDASLSRNVPVAMMGVVPTKVTADGGPIRPGDLLTTSRVPGYAMKATPTMVHGMGIYPTGAILGKALQPLSHGRGAIQVMLMSR
jgi:membrane-associated phospholipid phosphatase